MTWRPGSWRSAPLATRLAFIGILTSFLSVLLSIASFTAWDLMQFRAAIRAQISATAGMVATGSSATLNFSDRSAAHEDLASLRGDPHILNACLYDSDGALVAAFQRNTPCPQASVTTQSGLFTHIDASAPVALNTGKAGRIVLRRDLDDLRSLLLRSMAMVAAIMLGALLFAWWVSSRMALAVSRPIAALVDASRQITIERNYSLRLDADTDAAGAEIDLLVNSFNDMLERIEDGTRQLAAHGNRLEEQVAARTSELAQLNHELTEELGAREAAETALRSSRERYALAMDGANDGLWDWDLLHGSIYYSSRWKAMLGYEDAEIGADPEEWLGRAHSEDAQKLRGAITAHLAGLTSELQVEYRVKQKDGTFRWMLSRGLAIRDARGAVTRMAGSQTDITENKVSDSLTNLANRLLFTDRLSRCLDRARHDPAFRFAILFLDLDRFKVINDSLGYLAGDQLLVGIAQRLSKISRGNDLTARLGGDEFAMVVEDVGTPESARKVADRVHEELRAPFTLEGQSVCPTVSIGVAIGDANSRSVEDILRGADTAMYAAKAAGRARSEVYDPEMGERARHRLETETDLRSALANQELFLQYQPQVALGSGEIIGFEALVRWRHPRRGVVPPGEFIGIAEETGLIVPLGAWVLEEACRQMRSWQLRFPAFAHVTMSVNVSARQFTGEHLVPTIERILRETQLPARSLELEVTESTLLKDCDRVGKELVDLKNLGVGLQLDDFGTGYSSLSYLQRMQFGTLKIDRSFVSAIGNADGSESIVRTIVMLARGLRMRAVAEGIENEAQVRLLQELGCEFGQGYLFLRPLDADAAGALFTRPSLTVPDLAQLTACTFA